MIAKDFIKDFTKDKDHWLEKNKFTVALFMETYATMKLITELELFKKDIRALTKINASPLCCEDIDEQIKELIILQLKMLKELKL